MTSTDIAVDRLVDQVRTARSDRRQLRVCGGDTKSFYGEQTSGERMELRHLSGISSLEPAELVVTARAGTLLAELEGELASHGLHLAFEPPRYGPGSTIGGVVAAGLAGPSRATAGSIRDHLLGVTMLDGRGQVLTFGGQVMKNVAGYDLSRVLAGSLGVLGTLLEVSLKVLPLPIAIATASLECNEESGLRMVNDLRRLPLPLQASVWHDDRLWIRLAGTPGGVRAAAQQLGARMVDSDEAATGWTRFRDQTAPFFQLTEEDMALGLRLWRLSVPASTPPMSFNGPSLVEWFGAQRWLRSYADADSVRAAALSVGGHATIFRATDKASGVFTRPTEALARIHRGLKQTFDPDNIFNPGRLYAGL